MAISMKDYLLNQVIVIVWVLTNIFGGISYTPLSKKIIIYESNKLKLKKSNQIKLLMSSVATILSNPIGVKGCYYKPIVCIIMDVISH